MVAAVNWALLNPATVAVVQKHAADVIGGFVPGIAPERPSYGALIGSGVRWAVDNLGNSSGTSGK